MKSGGCYKTDDMTFYVPTQLLVSDTTCIETIDLMLLIMSGERQRDHVRTA